jgi:hypothetical protein
MGCIGAACREEKRLRAADCPKLGVILEAVGARSELDGHRRRQLSSPVGGRRLQWQCAKRSPRASADENVAGDVASLLRVLRTAGCAVDVVHELRLPAWEPEERW